MAEAKALDGVVVAELGTRVGVALCGSLLAQLGATVINVEATEPADGPRHGKALWREQFAAGKLSFAPDGGEGDRDLVEALAVQSDIVLTSSDVDPPILRAKRRGNPDNIVCDLTAFGASGPQSGQDYSELQVQALSGIMDTTGLADGPPVPIGVPIVNVLAGSYAVSAVLAAHRVKRLQHFGQNIDIALFDCAFLALGSFLSGTLISSGGAKSRLGNRHPTVAPWNLFRSRDGWVLICAGSQTQWERLCLLIGRPDFSTDFATQALRVAHAAEIDHGIQAWTQRFTTAECVEKLVEAAIACGPIAPLEDHPREANLDYRQMIRQVLDPVSGQNVFVPGSPLRLTGSPSLGPIAIPAPDQNRIEIERLVSRLRSVRKAPASPAKPARSLAGVRIIELGQYTTAPLCARQLAHLGAEVIKVERPGGDQSRTWVPHINGRSVSFRLNNADKRSLALDLTTEAGASALQHLIASADVLVENLKPGTLAKFGFSPQAVLQANPRIVYCSISGFGADSLYAKRPAFDMVIQAMSGFMSALNSGATPLKSGISTADTMGAVMAMAAILGALEYRDRTGSGQYIDLSMQDITAWLTLTSWNGAGARSGAPLVLPCAEGHLLVTASETGAVPSSVPPELRNEIASLSRERASARLAAYGIDATPILSVRESSLLPQTAARRLWFMMKEGGVDWPMLSSPLRLEATPPVISRPAPAVNEDGEAILCELGVAPPDRDVRIELADRPLQRADLVAEAFAPQE
jgi:crotonobetainyl-CoA:carnitine CoA-transferase CaiB-like acyl-CoA transferase